MEKVVLPRTDETISDRYIVLNRRGQLICWRDGPGMDELADAARRSGAEVGQPQDGRVPARVDGVVVALCRLLSADVAALAVLRCYPTIAAHDLSDTVYCTMRAPVRRAPVPALGTPGTPLVEADAAEQVAVALILDAAGDRPSAPYPWPELWHLYACLRNLGGAEALLTAVRAAVR